MSETSSGLENIKKRLKNLRHHSPKERQQSESETIAREAALLFVSSEQQEALATFEADGPSEFDLTQTKPGTIIRVEELSLNDIDSFFYSFIVVGASDKDQQKTPLYLIVPSRNKQSQNRIISLPTLILEPDWYLLKIKPISTTFPVKDFFKCMGYPTTANGETRIVSKLDLMTGGKTTKAPEREKAKGQAKLVPVAETA